MAASAGDVRAGGAFYEMYAKDAPLQAAVKRAQAAVAKFAGFVKSLPVVGGPFEALAKKLAPLGALTAKVAGGIRSAFAGVQGAVRGVGMELLKAGAAMGALGGAIGAPLLAFFKGGFDRAAELAQLNKQLGVPIEILNKLKYAADRAGVSLDEVMHDATGRYSADIAAAPAIDPKDAYAAAEAQKALADASRSVQDALLPLVQIVTPIVKQLGEWVKKNVQLVAVAAGVSAALVTIGGAAVALGGALVGAAGALGAVVLAIKPILIGAAVTAGLAVGLAQLGAVVGGLGYVFAKFTDTGRAAVQVLRRDLTDAAGTAETALGAIGNALEKGEFEGALAVAGAGLELLWVNLMERMTKEWVAFKRPIVEGFHDVFGGLGPLFDGIARTLGTVWEGAKEAFARVKKAVGDAWEQIKGYGRQAVDYLSGLWDRYGDRVMKALEPVKPFLAGLFAPVIAAVKLVQAAWDNLDTNIAVTVANMARDVEEVWARLSIGIKNFLKDIARTAVDVMTKVVDQFGKLNIGFDAKGALEAIDRVKKAIGDDEKASTEVDRIRKVYGDVVDRLRTAQENEKKARAERDADAVKAAEADAAKARGEFDKTVGDASVPGKDPKRPEFALRPNLVPDVSTKGQFGGANLAQSLGFADKAVQQTELLKQLNDTLKNNPAETARQLAPLVKPQTVR